MKLRWIVRFGLWVALPALVLAQDADIQKSQSLRIEPSAYVQFDFRGFPNWAIEQGTGRLNRDNVEIRRVRGGLDGEWRFLTFEFKIDPQDDDGVFVKDAYLEFHISESLSLRGGQFKLPGSREYLISARNIEFMERTSLAMSLAAGRDIGAMLEGEIGNRIDYQAGFFAGDGNGRRERAGATSAGRIEWEVLKDLDLGVSMSEGAIPAVADEEPENGLAGRSPSGYRFFDRVYEHGRRLRIGLDVEWDAGPWRITAEGLRVRDQRLGQGIDYDDLPNLVGKGWSVGTRWRFGGARHLSMRYEWMGFDDAGPETASDSVRPRATDIRAKAMHGVKLGFSWKPHRFLRFIGDAGVERYTELRSAPETGRTGNYYTLGSRIQFEWP